MQSIATTETIQRARRAVQSAHLYYTESMNLLDTVCSPGRSGFMAALSDEQSKADTYKGAPSPSQARAHGAHAYCPAEAAAWSHKAHVCLQECLRVLEPHMELLDSEQLAAAEQLREVGLLQGVRLYELMYGGKALAFGITRTSPFLALPVVQWLTSFARCRAGRHHGEQARCGVPLLDELCGRRAELREELRERAGEPTP